MTNFLLLLGVLGLMYVTFLFIVKNRPEYKVAWYEQKATESFKSIKEKLRRDVDKSKKCLAKPSSEECLFLSVTELERTISINRKQLEMESIFFRLKEKFKHDVNKKLEITVDWFDYVSALKELDLLGNGFQYGAYANMSMEEIDDEFKPCRIKRDEIQKKFFKLLDK